MASDPATAKRAAGRAAADLVEHGQVLGLGTGSTFKHALERLAERIHEEGLEVRGVATSKATERLARTLGVPLTDLERDPVLDLAIDGADEVAPDGSLIKGGGGALLREKVVAAAAREMVVCVGEEKLVERLGAGFLLPVEVLPFALGAVLEALRGLGAQPFVRTNEDGGRYTTDNGNWIVDCRFEGGIADPAALETRLARVPGVLENGLFVGLARRIVVGRADGSVELREPARA